MVEIKRFTRDDILNVHGDMYKYRDIYDGNHEQVFPRAYEAMQRGELVGSIMYGNYRQANAMNTPYVIANISKLIVDIPALFINRSIGSIETSISSEDIEADLSDNEVSDVEDYEEDLQDYQQDVIDKISENSNIVKWHGMNLKQWQIDGGIVAVPEIKNGKPRISFKERNVYYELDDGVTYQLRYQIEYERKNYVHVHEEIEEEDRVVGTHYLYKVSAGSRLELIEDKDFIEEVTGIDKSSMEYELKGRNETLFIYLPYEPTFNNQFGVSALRGQENKQDEVNWTLTRTAQIFERNGKPRISVTKDVMEQLQIAAEQRYGDERKISHRDLEITSIDEQGNSLEIHQIDPSKIGDVDYIKDIIKFMLIETQTSEKAIDFFSDEGSSYAESGTAKFYDLFLSLMKSERLRSEYTEFIRKAYENCLWIMKQQDQSVVIEKPDIKTFDMLPITSKETREMNNDSFDAGTQSLIRTVKNVNPEKSDEWIEREVEEIEAGQTSQDSFSINQGNMNLDQFKANKDDDGNNIPIDTQEE